LGRDANDLDREPKLWLVLKTHPPEKVNFTGM
jgi:hypothetical protein